MHKFRNILILISYLSILVTNFSSGQQLHKVMFSNENKDFVAPTDNNFRIIAQQNHPVTIDQLSATFTFKTGKTSSINIQDRDGYFTIHPDSLGIIKISIALKDTIETRSFNVVPIWAIGHLSSFKANQDIKIGIGEFKAQRGLTAVVECCGFDAKCSLLNYEVIRVSKLNRAERNKNKGDSYDANTKIIIDHAASGDLYIFRKIFYRCPLAEKPQRLDDMTFEIE